MKMTTTQETVWPCYPLTLNYEVAVPRPSSYMTSNYAGVVPSLEIPHFYNTVIEKPSPKESRKFFLDRSVFDLVDAHPYLALTDPKLLGWYLRLSPEDRKIIQDEGGFHQFLQRHPALELSSHHVYVKYSSGSTIPAQPSLTSNKHTSRTSGAENCRCEMEHTHFALEMFPNKRVHLQDSFQTALNSPIAKEPNNQKAHKVKPFSLKDGRPSWQMDSSAAVATVDMELERCRQGGRPELRSQTAVTQGQSANFTHADICLLESEWPTVEAESSFVDTANDEEASASFEDQSDDFYGIMEDDMSKHACLPSEDAKMHSSGTLAKKHITVGPVTTNSEALEALKPDQSVTKMNKYTSPMPCVATCDIMVGTEPSVCMSAFSQTEDPGTADKHVVTEVRMVDLDYLTEEFMKLKMAKELREQKEKMKRFACKVRKECDCIQRAQQAELCLLALQYSMCRQHCWRLYYTSEGGQLTTLPENPPANIVSVLQKLESDYNQMRYKILAGVPLEQLKPLSVDSEEITTGARYSPAQIIGDVLGNVPSGSSQEPHNTSGEENGSPDNQSGNCQHSQRKEQIKKNSNARRAVTFVPQYRNVIHSANKEEGNQTSAECKELSISEAWYDAEEDLEPSGPAAAADTGHDPPVITKDVTSESTSEEAKSSVLCVSNLPSNVTESDVMQWFEKYHDSDVSVCALKNDLRIAIVISGPQSAEAAVRELNGCSMQGHTLHVEHINRAVDGSHSQASASVSGPESSQDDTKPQTSKTESSKTERKLITEPPLSSSIKIRKVVCNSPTAKGTFVPQHYGTMGSFDTLMMELTQRHPDVGRQRIVDALMELKTQHQGVLSGLPLRTIREMTSELLTSPTSATQL